MQLEARHHSETENVTSYLLLLKGWRDEQL